MNIAKDPLNRVLIAIAVGLTLFYVSPLRVAYIKSYVAGNTLLTLSGKSPASDMAVNYLGARLLINHENPYPILGPALKKVGIDWDVPHASTHPPTAILLAVPLWLLTWPVFSMLWAWLMTLLLYISLPEELKRAPQTALLLAVLLFWPPISFSLGQLTIVWLSCVVMAYRYREKNPTLAGVFIGVATFTKFFPIIMLAPFILRKKWSALVGAAFVWLLAISILYLLDPQIWSSYIQANSSNFVHQMMREDCSSFPVFLYKQFGIPGALITSALFIGFVGHFLFFYMRQGVTRVIGEYEWAGYVFLSIILLPIAWVYSVVPLLPVLLKLLSSAKSKLNILGFIAFFAVVIFPPFGAKSIYGVFIFLMAIYASFFIGGSPLAVELKAGRSNHASKLDHI